MPAKSKETKVYNPSLGPMFPTKNGSGNFRGVAIDSKAFETLQSKITIGMIPLLKKAKSLDKKGGEYYFLEFFTPTDQDSI